MKEKWTIVWIHDFIGFLRVRLLPKCISFLFSIAAATNTTRRCKVSGIMEKMVPQWFDEEFGTFLDRVYVLLRVDWRLLIVCEMWGAADLPWVDVCPVATGTGSGTGVCLCETPEDISEWDVVAQRWASEFSVFHCVSVPLTWHFNRLSDIQIQVKSSVEVLVKVKVLTFTLARVDFS